jgi:predicted small metal-binding protein
MITKFKVDDNFSFRLSQETVEIQRQVKEFMKNYKKDITGLVLENMINKVK